MIKRLLERFKPKEYVPSGRVGILLLDAVGAGLLNKGAAYKIAIELEELETVGGLSKIKAIKISGADKTVVENVLPEWVPTENIMWKERK